MKKIIKILTLVLTTYLLLNTNTVEAKSGTAISLYGGVAIREKASKNSKQLYSLKRGQTFPYIGISGDFYVVQNNKKQIGYISKNSITNTFLLVDKSDQKLYAYKNGTKIGEANVITGKKRSHDTPNGRFVLRKKFFSKDKNLSEGYHVDYWMPFNSEAHIGFHDAKWRPDSDFNSNKTYIKNGSHGCVNMRTRDAKKLYENAPASIDVIVRD